MKLPKTLPDLFNTLQGSCVSFADFSRLFMTPQNIKTLQGLIKICEVSASYFQHIPRLFLNSQGSSKHIEETRHDLVKFSMAFPDLGGLFKTFFRFCNLCSRFCETLSFVLA